MEVPRKTKSTKLHVPNRFVMIVFGKQILRKNIEYQLMSDCLFRKTNIKKKPMYMVIVIRKRHVQAGPYKIHVIVFLQKPMTLLRKCLVGTQY